MRLIVSHRASKSSKPSERPTLSAFIGALLPLCVAPGRSAAINLACLEILLGNYETRFKTHIVTYGYYDGESERGDAFVDSARVVGGSL